MENIKALEAIDAANTGFTSNAAKQRILSDLNNAFDKLNTQAMGEVLNARPDMEIGGWDAQNVWRKTEAGKENSADYWDMSTTLHNLKEKHLVIVDKYCELRNTMEDLKEARTVVKATPITKIVKEETKADIVRTYVEKSLEDRIEDYLQKLDLTRHFGMTVWANAHWVTNQYGSTFIRHFYYLNGNLTALNTICAIAQTLKDEEDGKV